MVNKDPGYVYILTNSSFCEVWVKIGKSSRLLKCTLFQTPCVYTRRFFVF